MDERRRDPRTNKVFSLKNLLRMRAESEGLLLAVVGTPEGYIMGSSREATDRQAARVAAHVSSELFGASRKPWLSLSGARTPEMRLLATRFEVDGRPAFLAALVETARPFSLDGLAACVQRILNEKASKEMVAA
jgi:hypothetical protein